MHSRPPLDGDLFPEFKSSLKYPKELRKNGKGKRVFSYTRINKI